MKNIKKYFKNEKYVFVVYPKGNDAKKEHFEKYTATATSPEDLTFVN